MGIRETLDHNQPLTVGMVLVVIAAAGYLVYSQIRSGAPSIPSTTYFSTDDGQSYFTDDVNRLPPFEHDGKEAVLAHLYECNGKKFVGYLSKMDPKAKAAMERYQADIAAKPQQPPASWGPAQAAIASGWLHKKPGEKDWKAGSVNYNVSVNCDNGKPADVVVP